MDLKTNLESLKKHAKKIAVGMVKTILIVLVVYISFQIMIMALYVLLNYLLALTYGD